MCIRISLAPTAGQVAAAQWALVDALEHAVGDGWRYAEATRALHRLFRQARVCSPTPAAWAHTLTEALVEQTAALQAALSAAQAQLADQQARCERLTHALAAQEAQPAHEQLQQLQEQLARLTDDRDRWLRHAAQAEQRAESLEQALAAAQQAHQDEIAELEQRIADLNRIVVQQQEALNARNT